MSSNFHEKWEKEVGGLKGALRPTPSLKDRLNSAVRHIELQLNKVNEHIERYDRRERELLEKIVSVYERHDEARAKTLANELAEIRRHKSLLIDSKMSLDKTALRLRTIYEFGNFMSAISLARKTVGETREKIASIIPEINTELTQVEKVLDDVVNEVSGTMHENLAFDSESVEADRILEEAAIVAKNRANEVFPKPLKNNEIK